MKKYRIRNWSQYNKALKIRGSITLCFSKEVTRNWFSKEHTLSAGRPFLYSDDLILLCLLIREQYRLPLRGLEGFMCSLLELAGLHLPIPSYTQISRRARVLGKKLKKLSRKMPVAIVFDSTGLKVHGEGEWKVRQHGYSKRRNWKKLHIGIDPDSQEVLVAELTEKEEADSKTGVRLLEKAPKSIREVRGDGSYDHLSFRKAVSEIGAFPIIPPPKNARCHFDREDIPWIRLRNQALLEISGLGGDRKLWKKLVRYHRRSLVETAMFRLKAIFGARLRNRIDSNQRAEALVRCLLLNKYSRLGMPKGVYI